MILALTIFALTVGVGAYVLYPLLVPRQVLSEAGTATEELLLQRDQLLNDIRELEFDYRMGKLADDDYAQLLAQLKRQAAQAIEALEHSGGAEASPPAAVGRREASDDDIEARIAAARNAMAPADVETCPACGHDNPSAARFCSSCGAALGAEAKGNE